MTRPSRRAGTNVVLSLLTLGIFVACISCESVQSARSRREASAEPAGAKPAAAPATQLSEGRSDVAATKARFVSAQVPAETQRRIIYDAEISLVVKKMAELEAQVPKLLKQYNGYVSEAQVDRRQGEKLTGRWKVRIPTTNFDAFLDEIAKSGIAENRQQTAQDVTEDYVDLEAQIANKKKLEERIVAILKEASGKIKDVIEVEHELARVRGEIEQMEGRLRYLANRTDLTTITIVAREEEDYTPPAAPVFTNRVAQAWSSSLMELRKFGENLAVGTVYAFPWLALLGVMVGPFAWSVRKKMARQRVDSKAIDQ